MDNILEIIAIVVAVIGGLKAIDWLIDKITAQHDKVQQIDSNAQDFDEYKKETELKMADLQAQITHAHQYANESLTGMKKEIVSTIYDHRNEYLKGIDEVKQSLTEMSSIYQQTMAVVELKIDNLDKNNAEHLEQLRKAQEKHNNLMERTYICERDISLLKDRANNKPLRK